VIAHVRVELVPSVEPHSVNLEFLEHDGAGHGDDDPDDLSSASSISQSEAY